MEEGEEENVSRGDVRAVKRLQNLNGNAAWKILWMPNTEPKTNLQVYSKTKNPKIKTRIQTLTESTSFSTLSRLGIVFWAKLALNFHGLKSGSK